MDEALKQVVETPAYLDGYSAFDVSGPCPYVDDTPLARQWWQGWQKRAGEFIENELEGTKL